MANVGAMSKTYMSGTVKDANPEYIVHIKCAGMGLEIIADIPEEITTAVGSEWEAPLPSSVKDFSDILGKVATATGNNAVAQQLTKQVWVNSSPIEFPISLLFKAYSDPKKEVVDPIRILEMLAMPDTYTGFLANDDVGTILVSPGPNRGDFTGGGMAIELIVGTQLHFNSAILVSASSSMSSRLHDGWPIAGRVDLTFRSDRVLTRQDWALITKVNL